jgi:hypothetical protein
MSSAKRYAITISGFHVQVPGNKLLFSLSGFHAQNAWKQVAFSLIVDFLLRFKIKKHVSVLEGNFIGL